MISALSQGSSSSSRTTARCSSARRQPGLKLRHTNRDRVAFEEVMQAEPPIAYASLKHKDSLVVRAHQYFAGSIDKWLDEEPAQVTVRAEALAVALQNALELVVIQLTSTEDSQEIFETLNARGTPLTAADLIKNFVFQRLKLEGEDEAARLPGIVAFRDQVLGGGADRRPLHDYPQCRLPQPVARVACRQGDQPSVDLHPVQVLRRA